MSDTLVRTDLQQRFVELVHAKFREAHDLPGSMSSFHCDGGEGHDFANILLTGPEDGVRVTYDSEGRHRMVFANESKPAYELRIDDSGELCVDYFGDAENEPSLADQLTLVEGLMVSTNELVPYGWHENGLVTLIIYMSDITRMEMDGRVVNTSGLVCNVLEGHSIPDVLRMSKSDCGNDDWLVRYLDQIGKGNLIRLTPRIKELPEELWAKRDGDLPYLWFDASDGQLPAFAVAAKYIEWHPIESQPGESFGKQWRGRPNYANTMRNWFA